MFFVRTYSPEETFFFAERFAGYLKEGAVITVTGDLGAGKTLFAKGVAKGLGVKDHVTSPTFTIIQEYYGRVPFYHMDLYRLENEEEIMEIGLEEYLESSGVKLIEWPDRIKKILPDSYIRVQIEKEFDNQEREYRTILFFSEGEEFDNLIREFAQDENISS